MTTRRLIFETTDFAPRLLCGATKTVEYPIGMDYAHHPIGTQINVGYGWRMRKQVICAGHPHFAVPRHIADAMRSRKGGEGRLGSDGERMGVGAVTVLVGMMEGNHASHGLNEGWDFTIHCEVHGLVTASPTDPEDLYNDAEAAVVAIVGNRGHAGPNMSTGIPGQTAPTIIQGFTFEGLSPDFVKMAVHYKGYPLPTMKGGGGMGSIESNLDVFGNTISVQYHYPTDYAQTDTPSGNAPSGIDPSLANTTDTVSKLISRPTFEGTVTICFTIIPPCMLDGVVVNAAAIASYYKAQQGEVNANLYDPTNVSTLYPGLGFLLGAPGTYLLELVAFDSRDGMLTFEIEMTFHLRPTGWNQTVTYVCRDTGDPPADLIPGTGQKQVATYASVEFPTFIFSMN